MVLFVLAVKADTIKIQLDYASPVTLLLISAVYATMIQFVWDAKPTMS